jgi:hypothetical protein
MDVIHDGKKEPLNNSIHNQPADAMKKPQAEIGWKNATPDC